MKLLQGFGGFAGQTVAAVDVSDFDYIATAAPSAVSSIALSSCFSADYDHYLLEVNLHSSANSTDFILRLRNGETTAGGSDYRRQSMSIANNTVSAGRNTSIDFIYINTGSQTGGDGLSNFSRVWIFNPFAAVRTTFLNYRAFGVNSAAVMSMTQEVGAHDLTNSYDSLIISDSTGNMSGTADLYGWKV